MDLFRRNRQRQAQKQRLITARELRQRGFDYGLQAFRIMCEEMHRGRDLDDRAVFYSLARKSLSALRERGFTTKEIEQLIRDVNRS
jgi:SOS response regulatory protein OraA/RecX